MGYAPQPNCYEVCYGGKGGKGGKGGFYYGGYYGGKGGKGGYYGCELVCEECHDVWVPYGGKGGKGYYGKGKGKGGKGYYGYSKPHYRNLEGDEEAVDQEHRELPSYPTYPSPAYYGYGG